MEKKLVTQLTLWVVAISLVVVLGTAFWRASYRGWSGDINHQHDHSLEFFQKKPAWS